MFQAQPQNDDEASTSPRSTCDVAYFVYSTIVASSNEPSDCTTTSPCNADMAIDYTAKEMKKSFARHIA